MFRPLLVVLFLLVVAGFVAAQETPKSSEPAPKSTASEGGEVTEVMTVHYAWWWVLAQRVSYIAPVVLQAIIAIILFGIRADINRIAEQRGAAPPS
jgi:hypothetical protein